MPTLRPIHVSSFSSEDPHNPAANLLQGETFRKWKCKEPGEREAYVILKLEKAVTISAIDIGNEFSAFVEVLVARSGDDANPKFQPLLSKSAFMSPMESRNGTNPSRVRMFGLDALNKAIQPEKWDLVKVVCFQEFNTHVQFGLAFITLKTPMDPTEKPKLGGFAIRPAADIEEDSSKDPIRIGELFMKKAQGIAANSPNGSPKPGAPTVAASIRNASTSLASVAIASSEERMKELKRQKLLGNGDEVPIGRGPPSKVESPSARNSSWYGSPEKPTDKPSVSTPTRVNPKSSISSSMTKAEEVKRAPSSSQESIRKPARPKPKKTKPFNKLFEDVIFVMSGFENPYRANLRRKACDMGARCKHEWDSTGTHLVCAFINTPKFREVRNSGHGNIVTKEWIEESYRKKRRLPWRRFCLDRNDKGEESEEEICAEASDGEELMDTDEDTSKNSAGPTASTFNSQSSNDNNSEEEKTQPPSPKKRKRIIAVESDEDDEPMPSVVANQVTLAAKSAEKSTPAALPPAKPTDDDDTGSETYGMDTDVEDKDSIKSGGSPSLLQTADDENDRMFFSGNIFSFSSLISPKNKVESERLIRQFGGTLEPVHKDSVEYIITDQEDWDEEFSEAMAQDPNVTIVKVNWIFECGKSMEKLSVEPFTVLPN